MNLHAKHERFTEDEVHQAVTGYVLRVGLHHRERSGRIDFCWPEDGARHHDPPCRLYSGTGNVVDAKRGTTLNAKALAERERMTFQDFVRQFSNGITQRQAPAAQTPKPQIDRTPVFDPAWAALTTAPDEATEPAWLDEQETRTLAWVEGTRCLFAPAHIRAHCVVIDNDTAGPLLAACAGTNERKELADALPVVVMPTRNARTGLVSGLAWRSVAKRDADGRIVRKVITGSKGQSTDGTPLVYGLRADLALESPVIILVEGLADTLAAEGILPEPEPSTPSGLTPASPPIAVIGARDANHMANVVGPFLAQRTQTPDDGQVIIVAQHDDNKTGQHAAVATRNAIDTNRARLMDWSVFCRTLVQMGMPGDAHINDLADTISAAKRAGISRKQVWSAFASAITRGAQ